MSAPLGETVVAEPAPEVVAETVTPPAEPTVSPEATDGNESDIPAWMKEKLGKANREAQNLRARLKEQEPLVAAAQEAERAKLSEIERERAEKADIATRLSARETELLQSRYGITDDNLDLLGDGSFEEKEARAKRIQALAQPAVAQQPEPTGPPSQRPLESLRSGTSTPPPVADNSYPAAWGFQPPRQP